MLPNELQNHMKQLPVYIVEKNGQRTNIAFNDLFKEETFWTVDSQLTRSAEQLVREAKANSTVSAVVNALGDEPQKLPAGTILYNMDINRMLRSSVEDAFEPVELAGSQELRRAQIKWGAKTASKWIRVGQVASPVLGRKRSLRDARVLDYLRDMTRRDRRSVFIDPLDIFGMWLAAPDVPFYGIDGMCGIAYSHGRVFLRGDTEITKFLARLAMKAGTAKFAERLQVFATVFSTVARAGLTVEGAAAQLRRISDELGQEYSEGSEEFLEALSRSPTSLFSTSVWMQRDFGGDD